VFGAANRKRSEKYGFVVPLIPDLHTGNKGIHNGNRELDLKLKRKCQEIWLANGHTKEEWHREFGKWY